MLLFFIVGADAHIRPKKTGGSLTLPYKKYRQSLDIFS